jgi:hypothetical protein
MAEGNLGPVLPLSSGLRAVSAKRLLGQQDRSVALGVLSGLILRDRRQSAQYFNELDNVAHDNRPLD